MKLKSTEIERIWQEQIRPRVFRKAELSSSPVTVFLGAQPGAGKTQGGKMADQLHADRPLVHIVGDDYRKYHPDYKYLVTHDPLRMPAVTGHASGEWIRMCVEYAHKHSYSVLIEGTWRNPSTVLDAAKAAKAVGRATHAIALAVPPPLSQLGLLDRFYRDQSRGLPARWTPPAAHQTVIERLPDTVGVIAGSDLIDRMSITDRTGRLLCDDKTRALEVFETEFNRSLNAGERELIGERIRFIADCHARFTPSNTEAGELITSLYAQVEKRAPERSINDVLAERVAQKRGQIKDQAPRVYRKASRSR